MPLMANAQSPEPIKLQLGEATIKAKFINENDSMKAPKLITVHVQDPILGSQESYYAELGDDNAFEIKVPLQASKEYVQLANKFTWIGLVTSPGANEEIVFDISKRAEHIQNHYSKDISFMEIDGTNGKINNELINLREEVDRGFNYTAFKDSTMAAYRDFVDSCYKSQLSQIEEFEISDEAKYLAKLELRINTIDMLTNYQSNIGMAYKYSHQMDPFDWNKEVALNLEDPDNYFNIIEDYHLLDSDMIYDWRWGLRNLVGNYERKNPITLKEFTEELYALDKKGGLNDEMSAAVSQLLDVIEAKQMDMIYAQTGMKEHEFLRMASQRLSYDCPSFGQKHRQNLYARLFGSPDCILAKITEANPLVNNIIANMPIDDEKLALIRDLNVPEITEYAEKANARINADNDAFKALGGKMSFHKAQSGDKDDIINEIIANHPKKALCIIFCNDIYRQFVFQARLLRDHYARLNKKGVEFVYVLPSAGTPFSKFEEYFKDKLCNIPGHYYPTESNNIYQMARKNPVTITNKKGQIVFTGQDEWTKSSELINILTNLK